MRGISVAAVVAVIAVLLNAGVVSAHEHRQVNGYTIQVGFAVEPALVDEVNGLYLSVVQGEDNEGTPVEGLEETLQAEIIYGEERKQLDLRPVSDEPGVYTADVIPTKTGAYSFRIWGTLGGNEIEETFTSGPETFAEIRPKDELIFPSEINATDGSGGESSSDTLTITAVVLGALGLLAGVAGVVIALNVRNAQPRRATVTASEGGG